MGNCLVTKLKESVNNPNLIGLNDLVVEFDIKSDEYRTFVVRVLREENNPVLFTFSQYVDIYDITNTTVLESHTKSYSSNGDFLVRLPFNQLTKITCHKKQRIYFMSCNIIYDSINFIGFGGLTELVGYTFERARNVTGIQTNGLGSSNKLDSFSSKSPISGDIANLIGCTVLTMLHIEDSNIVGNIDTVLNACAATGRTNTLDLKIPSGVSMTGRTTASAYTIQFANNSWSII